MTYRGRSEWQTMSNPITGPAPRQTARQGVAHWPGSSSIPTDAAAWLRSMQADWTRNRGFSLGYWALVEQNGDAWQIRGPGPTPGVFNSAANPGRLQSAGNANDWTAPILFAIPTPAGTASPAAIATARALWAQWGITTRPVPHSTLDPTSCCGPGLTAQINAGELDPISTPPPAPPAPSPTGDSDMLLFRRHGPGPNNTGYSWTGTHLAWMFDGHAAGVAMRAGSAQVDVSDVELTSVIRSSMTTTPPPPTLNAEQLALWNTNRRT